MNRQLQKLILSQVVAKYNWFTSRSNILYIRKIMICYRESSVAITIDDFQIFTTLTFSICQKQKLEMKSILGNLFKVHMYKV